MKEKKIEKVKPDEGVLVKSGLLYTVCNFLFKAVVFLTAPFFARMLTKADMGISTTFSSMVLILSVLTGLDMQESIILLKNENDRDMDSYIFSILSLTTIMNAIVGVILIALGTYVEKFLGIPRRYMPLMCAYLVFIPAYQMYITRHRAYYNYRRFVTVTGLAIVPSALVPLFMVMWMEDKLTARLVGNYLPYIVLGAALYMIIAVRGKRIKLRYWKSALKLCLPLVPHALSMYLLSSSDKMILTALTGAELTAMYGVAYLVYNVVGVLYDSLMKGFSPWLIENLHDGEREKVKKISKIYILIFAFIAIGGLLIGPELIYILGGKKYAGAEHCLPPLICSCVIQFVYNMYVNVEFYKKKTGMVSVATMIATAVNIILNFIFIPMWLDKGYVVAAYTTLAGYTMLFAMHFLLVKRLGLTRVFDTGFMLGTVLVFLLLSPGMSLLYSLNIVRLMLILLYAAAFIYLIIKYKEKILSFIKH